MKSIGENITFNLIEAAGIKQGMKVLDLGCGNGNVSFLFSEYLGKDGLLVGVDYSEKSIQAAQGKAKYLGLNNFHFITKDITSNFELNFKEFDVIIVRRVLMYLSNPRKTVQAAAKFLKSGGIFLAQENNVGSTPIGLNDMPEHAKTYDLIKRTLVKENINFNMGLELDAVLNSAGLEVQKIWAETIVSTPKQPTAWAFLAEVMKDRMLIHNIIKDVKELELENLKERISAERSNNDKSFITDLVFCAIAKKP